MPQQSFVIDVASLFVNGQLPAGITVEGWIAVTGQFFGGNLGLAEDKENTDQARAAAERIEAAIKGAM